MTIEGLQGGFGNVPETRQTQQFCKVTEDVHLSSQFLSHVSPGGISRNCCQMIQALRYIHFEDRLGHVDTEIGGAGEKVSSGRNRLTKLRFELTQDGPGDLQSLLRIKLAVLELLHQRQSQTVVGLQ